MLVLTSWYRFLKCLKNQPFLCVLSIFCVKISAVFLHMTSVHLQVVLNTLVLFLQCSFSVDHVVYFAVFFFFIVADFKNSILLLLLWSFLRRLDIFICVTSSNMFEKRAPIFIFNSVVKSVTCKSFPFDYKCLVSFAIVGVNISFPLLLN